MNRDNFIETLKEDGEELWEKCLRLIRENITPGIMLGLRLYIFCLFLAMCLSLQFHLKCITMYWKIDSLKFSLWQSANILEIM